MSFFWTRNVNLVGTFWSSSPLILRRGYWRNTPLFVETDADVPIHASQGVLNEARVLFVPSVKGA